MPVAVIVRTILIVLSLVCAAVGVAEQAEATPVSIEEARAAVLRGYETLDRAVGAKDVATIEQVYAKDAVFIAQGFAMTLPQFQTMLRDMLAATSEISQSTDLQSLTTEENGRFVAITKVRTRMVTAGSGAGTTSSTEILSVGKEDWRLTSAGWRIVRSADEGTPPRTFIDGVEQGVEAPLTSEERAAVVADLKSRARPLAAVDAGTDTADLAFLDSFVGDARIVALGESSHGSSEQFRMKRRIIEYLVERKGFTVVAFEANWADALATDRYVKGGEGSIETALSALGYWVWRTEEVKELLEWMREQNARRPPERRLTFAGIDIQQKKDPVSCVLDALQKAGETDHERAVRLYTYETPPDGASDEQIEAALDVARKRVREARSILEAAHDRIVPALSERDFQTARQCATVIVQALDNLGLGLLAGQLRDPAMADNVKWLADVDRPGEKIIVWAHNGHVGNQPTTMGESLRKMFGSSLVVIGQAVHDGEIRANPVIDGITRGSLLSLDGPVSIPLAAPAPGSLSDVVAGAEIPAFFLDLKGADGGALAHWLARPLRETSIGWPYDPSQPNTRTIVLPTTYDALIFIAKSSATTLAR